MVGQRISHDSKNVNIYHLINIDIVIFRYMSACYRVKSYRKNTHFLNLTPPKISANLSIYDMSRGDIYLGVTYETEVRYVSR